MLFRNQNSRYGGAIQNGHQLIDSKIGIDQQPLLGFRQMSYQTGIGEGILPIENNDTGLTLARIGSLRGAQQGTTQLSEPELWTLGDPPQIDQMIEGVAGGKETPQRRREPHGEDRQ